MRKAFLHIGTMKTGTSSIQNALLKNEETLARNNMKYLNWPMRHSSAISPLISDRSNIEKDIVICDEGLWHFAFSRRSDTKNIAKLLRDFDVKIILYLRRIDYFLESWFFQGLKTGTGAINFSTFLKNVLLREDLDFIRRIESFEALFGRGSFIIRPYEENTLEEGNVVSDFKKLIGLDNVEFSKTVRTNVTPSRNLLLLKSIVRHSLPDGSKHHLSILDDVLKIDSNSTEARILTLPEAELLRERFSPVYKEALRRWGNGCDPDVFSEWRDLDTIPITPSRMRVLQEASTS